MIMTEQTELENVVEKIFQEESIEKHGRFYHFKFDIATEKEGKIVSERLPWFCAGDNDLYRFIEGWSFFSYGNHKRLRIEYVTILFLYALTHHADEISGTGH